MDEQRELANPLRDKKKTHVPEGWKGKARVTTGCPDKPLSVKTSCDMSWEVNRGEKKYKKGGGVGGIECLWRMGTGAMFCFATERVVYFFTVYLRSRLVQWSRRALKPRAT